MPLQGVRPCTVVPTTFQEWQHVAKQQPGAPGRGQGGWYFVLAKYDHETYHMSMVTEWPVAMDQGRVA